MALVMLPCDLPWWGVVHKKLAAIQNTDSIEEIMEIMQKIHDLCNISLDPDDDNRDSTIFNGFKDFLMNELNDEERTHCISVTLKTIAKRAQSLKMHRPPSGLQFSLQQHADIHELNYDFVSALVANAFFSTFPKRTEKTHPTLQDFNFSYFFAALETNSQKAKLRVLFHYFDWLESTECLSVGGIKLSRKVMNGKQWLTIEDWLECGLPLCSLEIKHEGRLERANYDVVQTVFASSRLGGNVLRNGNTQECMQFSTFPELLAVLLYIESLEDNECLMVDGARQMGRIIDPKNKAILEKFNEPRKATVCLVDAENYHELPVTQFEEDNILRELNKCLLGFRQNSLCPEVDIRETERRSLTKDTSNSSQRRLSPIGESGTSSPRDVTRILIRQATSCTRNSSFNSGNLSDTLERRRSWLAAPPSKLALSTGGSSTVTGPLNNGRRGRFIILGSSGECLPISRKSLSRHSSSVYSSCDSDSDEYVSAKNSFDDGIDSDEDKKHARKYSNDLSSPEKRYSFAMRLKEALERSGSQMSESTESEEDSSYAVDISISGSKGGEEGLRIRRGGSRGFMLKEDSLDEDFYKESLAQEKEWLDKFRNKRNQFQRRETNDSSKYSFASELGSEWEEVYEQFSKWLDDPILKDKNCELDPRDTAVLRFASSLLKRTLSESFVGVPLTEGCTTSTGIPAEERCIQEYQQKKEKPVLSSRSLSLELAKYKHRLAAQLSVVNNRDLKPSSLNHNTETSKITKASNRNTKKWSLSRFHSQQTLITDAVTMQISQLDKKRQGMNSDLKPVATGNWGCGERNRGNPQLKLVIQWMAASVAGLPILIYYTAGNEKLAKLDTLCRVLLDREWTVGELASASLLYAKEILDNPNPNDPDSTDQCFFESLIGI